MLVGIDPDDRVKAAVERPIARPLEEDVLTGSRHQLPPTPAATGSTDRRLHRGLAIPAGHFRAALFWVMGHCMKVIERPLRR